MAKQRNEKTLELPSEFVDNSVGLSVDIGHTLIDIVYRSKEDYEQGKPRHESHRSGTGVLRLLTCPWAELDSTLDYVNSTCDWRLSDSPRTVTATGTPDPTCIQAIQEKLGASVKFESGLDCTVGGLQYLLNHQNSEQLFQPPPKEGLEAAQPLIDFYDGFVKNMDKFMEGTVEWQDTAGDLWEDYAGGKLGGTGVMALPCILCDCGAGLNIIKVDKDGSYTFLDSKPAGGTFTGLAKSVIGEQDYSRLMEAAVRGDVGQATTVDVYAKDIKGEDGDAYALFPDDVMVFPFGRLVTDDLAQVNRDHLVFSLLQIVCYDLVQSIHMYATNLGINNTYFCGNFATHPLVRKYITSVMALRNFSRPPGSENMNYQWLHSGSHLGALGAYLKGSQDAVAST